MIIYSGIYRLNRIDSLEDAATVRDEFNRAGHNHGAKITLAYQWDPEMGYQGYIRITPKEERSER